MTSRMFPFIVVFFILVSNIFTITVLLLRSGMFMAIGFLSIEVFSTIVVVCCVWKAKNEKEVVNK